MITLSLRSESEARAVENTFNAFHDAFFARVELSSADRFLEDAGQLCTGELILVLDICHRNYEAADHGRGRVVRGTFRGVRNVALSFRGRAAEWNIFLLTFHGATRETDAGTSEPCLRTRLVQNVYEVTTGWAHAEDDIFAFTSATIEELGAV